ncbi:LysR family transcriptional regulator [Paraburkholderia sp. DHOC27]|uniref:LysR family transcriptional regulator n=1 Tax=Paraburkholderia sp. DHOC27 TaxID=2303330 RepID=UPI000E3DCFE8|nr:LysR family transcriptional regulator [Paraburkholderia sp. DHOC27]RFU44672.1 LysR family transcriptional regulator [Paraburkholderia sp. DHOC27]
MDYIENLRHFRAVMEAGSFTKAADMLSVTTPVVSRAIAGLEAKLGTRLFHRTTRQMSATEAAERLYERAIRVLDEIDALEADATGHTAEATGILRLVAHTTATVNRLVPLIASFKRAQPKVILDVTLSERPVDLVADGYDLGIVVPYMLSSELTVTRLLERIPQLLVAAPAYLERHALPRDPADLAGHTFVTMSPAIRKQELGFRIGEEEVTVPLNGDVSSNSPMFNRTMILEGFGLGVIPQALVQDELDAGKLVPVLPDFPLMDDAIEIRLAYNTRTLMPAKVRVFIEHAAAFYEALAGADHA